MLFYQKCTKYILKYQMVAGPSKGAYHPTECYLTLDVYQVYHCQSLCQNCQVSAVADEPARRAASWQTCCKQRWTLNVINLRPN